MNHWALNEADAAVMKEWFPDFLDGKDCQVLTDINNFENGDILHLVENTPDFEQLASLSDDNLVTKFTRVHFREDRKRAVLREVTMELTYQIDHMTDKAA